MTVEGWGGRVERMSTNPKSCDEVARPSLPTTVCSVVWSDGHPWVLDGEPGVHPGITPRFWIGRGTDNHGAVTWRDARTMQARGFSVIYVDPGEH